jgi:2-dehydropantoate 2-reductase
MWVAHVAAINEQGLQALGVPEPVEIRVAAAVPADAPIGQELALVAVDANGSEQAAALAAHCLRPDGVALTLQNGIGNVEKLSAALGRQRVVGGSTMCSFRTIGPGAVEQTNVAKTIVGELDGAASGRVTALRDLLRAAGYPTEISTDIMAAIWEKLIVNVTINPICGITGLRMGELARLPATDRYQDRLIEEALAVARAKGLVLPEADLRARIKAHCWDKYSKPSMLQHLEAGRRTEIAALNGALVREAQAVGVAVPFNEAIALLIEGRQLHEQQRSQGANIDYAALEAAATLEPRP